MFNKIANKFKKTNPLHKKPSMINLNQKPVNSLSFKDAFTSFFDIFKVKNIDFKNYSIVFILTLVYVYFFTITGTASSLFFQNATNPTENTNTIASLVAFVCYTLFLIFPFLIVTFINNKHFWISFKRTLFNIRLFMIYFFFIFTIVFVLSRLESFIMTYTTKDTLLSAVKDFSQINTATNTEVNAANYPAAFKLQEDMSHITTPAIIFLMIECILYLFISFMITFFSSFLVAESRENSLLESVKRSFKSYIASPLYLLGYFLIIIALVFAMTFVLSLLHIVAVNAIFMSIIFIIIAKMIKELFHKKSP